MNVFDFVRRQALRENFLNADRSEFSVEKNSSDTNGRYPHELNVR